MRRQARHFSVDGVDSLSPSSLALVSANYNVAPVNCPTFCRIPCANYVSMLASQKSRLIALIEEASASAGVSTELVTLERPKIEAHGDIATNHALRAAKADKKNPREVANVIVDALLANPASTALIESAAVAGPGFINFRLTQSEKQRVVRDVLAEGQHFGTTNSHAGEHVMVEFVSANP